MTTATTTTTRKLNRPPATYSGPLKRVVAKSTCVGSAVDFCIAGSICHIGSALQILRAGQGSAQGLRTAVVHQSPIEDRDANDESQAAEIRSRRERPFALNRTPSRHPNACGVPM